VSPEGDPLADLATVVLAAGAGSRFGGPKQLAELDGEPLLGRVLAALDGLGDPQIVVLGAHAERVRTAVPTPAWRPVVAEDWEAGPGASLRAGLEAAPAATAALVVLGDLGWLRREAAERVLAAAAADPAEAVRAFEGERPGHPLLLRGALLERARAAPDAGLASLPEVAQATRVECAGLGVGRDVDTPSDLPRERL
jgi:nicotine blue oxidoreductase